MCAGEEPGRDGTDDERDEDDLDHAQHPSATATLNIEHSRMEVPSVLLSSDIWREVGTNLAGGAQRGMEVEVV